MVTPEWLALVAGALLSLGFSYIPGLNTWYGGLTEQYRRLVMAGALLLVAVGVFGLSCLGWEFAGINVPCSLAGAQGLVQAFILALIANQATYLISPQTQQVKAVKAAAG